MVYRLSGTFPKHEIYGLTSQFRRAAVSIAANIAEGFRKRNKAYKLRYLNIAQGSVSSFAVRVHWCISQYCGSLPGCDIISIDIAIRSTDALKNRDELFFDLKLVDNLVGVTFGRINLEFYFAGGSACILAGYIDRATRDFDFVDIGYSSKLAKVLKLLEPYDLLTSYFAAIPKNYAERVQEIEGFQNIKVFIFSKEDIIASKIDRLSDKDLEDIRILMDELVWNCLNNAYWKLM